MKSGMIIAAAAIAALVGGAQTAAADSHAAACTFEKDVFDFTPEEVAALYDCVSDDLAAGYAAHDDAVGAVYRTWGNAATGPAVPGPHGNRFLNTFVNEIGFDTYVEYGYGDDFAMPVGTVIAKESFKLRNDGTPRPGPLFIMTKVEPGTDAAEFGDWIYAGVQPNGKTMGVKQAFCHDCHAAYADQDSLGYPVDDVRLVTE
jgi:hypothetical protein